jgi:hypothetical protein
LLTCYSPVRHSLFISIATEWSAFDLHVLGTPPAFVLSQDQTLHRDSRPVGLPEGCSAGQESESHHDLTRTIGNHRPLTQRVSRPVYFLIDVQPIRLSPNGLPALAFGSHYSVFKERPGTHLSCRCWCRVSRRTVPDELRRRKVSFGCRRARGGRSDGCVTLADARRTVNACARPDSTGHRPRTGLGPMVAGQGSTLADARPSGPARRIRPARGHRAVACGEPPGPPHATRCSKPNWLSASPWSPNQATGGVRRLLISSIYRMSPSVTSCDDSMMHSGCCRVVTGR